MRHTNQKKNRLKQIAGLQAALAVLCGIATLASLVVPEWIEVLTGFDADNGSGQAESGFAVALLTISMVLWLGSLLTVRKLIKFA